jgi:protein-disulfide isomerase
MDDQEKIIIEEDLKQTSKGNYHVSFEESLPSRKQDRFLPISIMVAAALIGGALIFSTLYKGGAATPGGTGDANNNGAAAGAQQAGAAAAGVADAMKVGPHDAVLGSASAPVTIVEYGDYQCPFCTRFFSDTEPLIVSNYVQAGKVKMIFRNFPFLGPESTAAANAAQCANDQGKLWAYHDALYSGKIKDEAKGGGENDGYFSRALFLQLAQQVGLNTGTFTTCLDGNKDMATVTAEKNAASAAGINSTPAFIINGTQILGAQPYAQFQAAIEAALTAAK